MKKKIIVSVFVFILVTALTIGAASLIISKVKTKDIKFASVTSSHWIGDVGFKVCEDLVSGVPQLKYSIKGNKGGIIVDFYYKNYGKLSDKDIEVLKEKIKKLSKTLTLSLVSYGIDSDNANCIINVRTKKSDEPKLSLINNDMLFF